MPSFIATDLNDIRRMEDRKRVFNEHPWLWAIRQEWDLDTIDINRSAERLQHLLTLRWTDVTNLGYEIWIHWVCGSSTGVERVESHKSTWLVAEAIHYTYDNRQYLIRNIILKEPPREPALQPRLTMHKPLREALAHNEVLSEIVCVAIAARPRAPVEVRPAT